MFEISNGIAVQILEVTGRERVMLLFDVIIPVPHCTEQWGYLSTYSNNIAYVSFPIAFNTTLRMAFTGDITESISTINSHSVGNVTSATMEIRQAQKMDTDGTYWLAIGR